MENRARRRAKVVVEELAEVLDMVVAVDYWRCESGELHNWAYRGKKAQRYLCLLCQLNVTKAALKENTDNA